MRYIVVNVGRVKVFLYKRRFVQLGIVFVVFIIQDIQSIVFGIIGLWEGEVRGWELGL